MYVALDDIAFDATEDGKPVARTASPGEVVELTDKDARALLARGAVRPATAAEVPVIVTVVTTKQLKE